jgi:hypothetical protein
METLTTPIPIILQEITGIVIAEPTKRHIRDIEHPIDEYLL